MEISLIEEQQEGYDIVHIEGEDELIVAVGKTITQQTEFWWDTPHLIVNLEQWTVGCMIENDKQRVLAILEVIDLSTLQFSSRVQWLQKALQTWLNYEKEAEFIQNQKQVAPNIEQYSVPFSMEKMEKRIVAVRDQIIGIDEKRRRTQSLLRSHLDLLEFRKNQIEWTLESPAITDNKIRMLQRLSEKFQSEERIVEELSNHHKEMKEMLSSGYIHEMNVTRRKERRWRRMMKNVQANAWVNFFPVREDYDLTNDTISIFDEYVEALYACITQKIHQNNALKMHIRSIEEELFLRGDMADSMRLEQFQIRKELTRLDEEKMALQEKYVRVEKQYEEEIPSFDSLVRAMLHERTIARKIEKLARGFVKLDSDYHKEYHLLESEYKEEVERINKMTPKKREHAMKQLDAQYQQDTSALEILFKKRLENTPKRITDLSVQYNASLEDWWACAVRKEAERLYKNTSWWKKAYRFMDLHDELVAFHDAREEYIAGYPTGKEWRESFVSNKRLLSNPKNKMTYMHEQNRKTLTQSMQKLRSQIDEIDKKRKKLHDMLQLYTLANPWVILETGIAEEPVQTKRKRKPSLSQLKNLIKKSRSTISKLSVTEVKKKEILDAYRQDIVRAIEMVEQQIELQENTIVALRNKQASMQYAMDCWDKQKLVLIEERQQLKEQRNIRKKIKQQNPYYNNPKYPWLNQVERIHLPDNYTLEEVDDGEDGTWWRINEADDPYFVLIAMAELDKKIHELEKQYKSNKSAFMKAKKNIENCSLWKSEKNMLLLSLEELLCACEL